MLFNTLNAPTGSILLILKWCYKASKSITWLLKEILKMLFFFFFFNGLQVKQVVQVNSEYAFINIFCCYTHSVTSPTWKCSREDKNRSPHGAGTVGECRVGMRWSLRTTLRHLSPLHRLLYRIHRDCCTGCVLPNYSTMQEQFWSNAHHTRCMWQCTLKLFVNNYKNLQNKIKSF